MKALSITYKEFVHYGERLSSEDYDFTKYGGHFCTLQVWEYEDIKYLVILSDGEVISIEELPYQRGE
jgi:hypothetical protein